MEKPLTSTVNSGKSIFVSLLKTARPHQWVKNIFVIAPLVFSRNLKNIQLFFYAFAAFMAFCLASSAIYFFNDLKDIKKDRVHPKKKYRPIPAGNLSVSTAMVVSIILAVISVSLAFYLDITAAFFLLAYIVLNVLYSIKLKHIPYVDVFLIATGFIFRVAMGAFAIGVGVSNWILINTLFLSLFLGFGKRYHELRVYGVEALKQRPVLKGYSAKHLHIILISLTLLIPTTFLFYSFSEAALLLNFRKIYMTAPLIFLTLIRFFYICHNKDTLGSPTEIMLKDPLFISGAIFWAGSILALIYF